MSGRSVRILSMTPTNRLADSFLSRFSMNRYSHFPKRPFPEALRTDFIILEHLTDVCVYNKCCTSTTSLAYRYDWDKQYPKRTRKKAE